MPGGRADCACEGPRGLTGRPGQIDLSTGSGRAKEGTYDDVEADITLTTTDENFVKLSGGSLNPQMAFMTGKLKIKGSMGLAMKLQPVLGALAPKAKL